VRSSSPERQNDAGKQLFRESGADARRLKGASADHSNARRVCYSSVIESDVPVVVQHTRLDSRQAENAPITTIAFPLD